MAEPNALKPRATYVANPEDLMDGSTGQTLRQVGWNVKTDKPIRVDGKLSVSPAIDGQPLWDSPVENRYIHPDTGEVIYDERVEKMRASAPNQPPTPLEEARTMWEKSRQNLKKLISMDKKC